jgi:hypothetical protein
MKPRIDGTVFGSITIEHESYKHDVMIRLSGKVKKRKKKLSKMLDPATGVRGSSHTISLGEAEYVFQKGAELLIIGTGQFGLVSLSPEASAYFEKENCRVELLPTKEAAGAWNAAEGAVIGLFHVTC